MPKTEKMEVRSAIPEDLVRQKIFIVQGRKVMLDRDLARLYGVETRALNQAVKRNLKRFPPDFMFILSREEVLRISQDVISLKFSKNVTAFTEQGIAMLSTVLHSERAIEVNIVIMRTFVKLKEALSSRKAVLVKLAELERKIQRHDEDIHSIFEAIRKLVTPPEKPKRQIGFHP